MTFRTKLLVPEAKNHITPIFEKKFNDFTELNPTSSRVCNYSDDKIISPVSPVSPKDQKDKQDRISPIVPPPYKGDKGLMSQDEIKTFEVLRKELLQTYLKKQPFRVAVGKSQWIPYTHFEENYNLREILNDEVVIEFDEKHFKGTLEEFKEFSWKATLDTGVKLYQAGYTFEIWEHGGKSPHIHIHNLPIGHLSPEKRALFKKLFIRKYVDLDFLPFVDISLTGIHLIALEWANHWKGKYKVKELWNNYIGVKL